MIAAAVFAALPPAYASATTTTVTLSVDATDAPRQVWHARLAIPITSDGDITLVYPKWIPGNHGPTGPIANLGSLRAACNGAPVAWTRDTVDPYMFRFAVPPGAHELDVSYDLFEGTRAAANMTPQLAVLDWNQVVLYPKDARARDVTVAADIELPTGWTAATSLSPSSATTGFTPLRGHVRFATVTLETLVDSPLYTGAHERVVPLVNARGMTSEVDLFADATSDIDPTSLQIARWHNLVTQADALFGRRHWQHYHFLVTLSDAESGRGLEHHESSANGLPERYLSDSDIYEAGSDLLAHEYTHSWNGKYRRPFGLMTPNFQVPMIDDDLYVYEGLTQYWGIVLAARSGLSRSGELAYDLSSYYAALDVEPGRSTRPLIDTARAQGLTRAAQSAQGRFARRGEDYYTEGALIWLDADTLIRERTHGRKSLDDFARAFFGGSADTPPAVIGYTRRDIIAALNDVLAYDWTGFFHTRVDVIAIHPPNGGLARGGRHLTFTSERNDFQIARERMTHTLDATYSLGTAVDADGTVRFTIDTLPLARAGVAAGAKILAVNDAEYSLDRLRLALHGARSEGTPITLILDDLGVIRRVTVDYHGGERYPQLVRDPERADILAQIGAPVSVRPRR